MDQNTKKRILAARALINQQKYQQALDEAEIIIYKNSKVFQAHLLAGYCYDKLGKLKEAQKSYLEVIQLKPEQPNGLKALCDLYTKMGNTNKSSQFMEKMIIVQKTTQPIKYRQNLAKLVKMYQKNQDMQKIDKIFKELLESENEISQQFVAVAESYFRTGVTNKCFYLEQFLPLGLKGEGFRELQPNAKQKLNQLLIQIVRFLNSVKIQYKMHSKDVSNSIYQMRQCFPYSSCFLMLFLLDQYSVSQTNFNSIILQQIYMVLTAYYDKANNCYLNIETLEPQIFTISMILSYEYLAFMKEFFVLDETFEPYYEKLQALAKDLESRKIREQYSQKILKFILKQCRSYNKISETQNIEDKLESLKHRIVKLDGSYLEEVVAKMAMNCFVNYQKLCDMRNLLKTRINNLKQGEIQPHLYKYYYDYLIKIAKMYKSLDEQISFYDTIKYIQANDPKDLKYMVEYYWTEVGKKSKESPQIFKQTARNSMDMIAELLPKLTGSVKSQAIRKHTVLKMFLGEYDGVSDGLKLALGTDRSFENLQSIGFYYFIEGDYQRALRFLKQAFVTRQNQYHLNRAIFVSMIKTKQYKQANAFLQRIYEGFPNVFWINYSLGINSINNRRFEQAYKYLSIALQSFISGTSKSFKFSYQKTIECQKYSLIYMIDQNKFQILFDQFVVPEQKIHDLFPLASSLFYNQNADAKQVKIQTQLGEILKILGRNKSSFNHLFSAFNMLTALPQKIRQENLLQTISTSKQYATILFYMKAYKQAQQIFKNTLKICKNNQGINNIQKGLLSVYTSQIYSLLFQVSVMRLDELMKFESYESVEDYINKFNQDLKQLEGLVQRPSLNYYKAKYQFHILCYLHNKNIGVERSIETIRDFLTYFGLDYCNVESDQFYNRLVQLKNQERIIVKQCLEDYYVLLYMRQNSASSSQNHKISASEVLNLIQLFPTSSVFYIVYGMVTEQTKLKIASFLKCIQLDRQSPISVDLLASLFLKQKDYLTACKLFLKSLQIDLTNPKSYIGLCTCLYVLIGSSIKKASLQDKDIIRKALNKINSYMQFLRMVDPSENYHMLKFLKTLISDQPVPLFELKAGLEQSRKLTAHKYSQKLLYQLLQESTQYLKQFNIWKEEGQQQIFKAYLANNNIKQATDSNLEQIAVHLLTKIWKQIAQSKLQELKSGEIRIKIKCKLLNKLTICGNVFGKVNKFGEAELRQFVDICANLQENQQQIDEEFKNLQKVVKDILLSSLIKSWDKHSKNAGKLLDQIKQLNLFKVFKNVTTFNHIQIYLDHFCSQECISPLKKYILYNFHLFPCDPVLRKTFLSWLLIIEKQNNKITKKIKNCVDYRLDQGFQMNSDQQANSSQRFHKKHILMYNVQEPNAWIGFISQQWKSKKQTKWIPHLQRMIKMYQGKQNILPLSSKRKAEWLLFQMQGKSMADNQQIKMSNNPQQNKISALSTLFKLVDSNDYNKINQIFKKLPQQQFINMMKYVAPLLVKKYKHSQKMQQILNKCIKHSTQPEQKGFFNLLKFISLASRASTSEEQLVQQLKKLFDIIQQCEPSEQNRSMRVHPNAMTVMKCFVALLSINYQQLEHELSTAFASNRFAHHSDQVLINYFQIMRLYKQVQTNHQAENVYQNFTQYINAMIQLVKDTSLRGFFFSLKAMAGAIVAEESTVALSRQLKYALLLDPQLGRSMLTRK